MYKCNELDIRFMFRHRGRDISHIHWSDKHWCDGIICFIFQGSWKNVQMIQNITLDFKNCCLLLFIYIGRQNEKINHHVLLILVNICEMHLQLDTYLLGCMIIELTFRNVINLVIIWPSRGWPIRSTRRDGDYV